MDVPTGLHVSPDTKEMLKAFPTRAEVMEMCMSQADNMRKLRSLLEDVEGKLRIYAGEDGNNCEACHEVVDAVEAFDVSWGAVAAFMTIVTLSHGVHHDHSDGSTFARTKQLEEFTRNGYPILVSAQGKAEKATETLMKITQTAQLREFILNMLGDD